MKVESVSALASLHTPGRDQTQSGAASCPAELEQHGVRRGDVYQAVEHFNQRLAERGQGVRYQIHEKTHRLIVQLVDSKTQAVLGEIPPAKVLDMIAAFTERQSVAVDQKV